MIRPACQNDVEAIRHVVWDAYGTYVALIGPPAPMLDDYDRRIAGGQAWILEEDGRLAGVLVLKDGQLGTLLVDNLAVAPMVQGKGHGRALLAFAEEEARRRGHGAVHLYTNVLMARNLEFYRRLGFRETGRVTEKGFRRIYMVRPVAPRA